MRRFHTVLLIGGTGFVGEYLTRQLQKKTKYQLLCIHASPLTQELFRGVQDFQIDLRKPLPPKFLAPRDIQTIVILTQPNELIMTNILKIMKKLDSLQKIIYVSTILFYPESAKKQGEDTLPEPISSYERGKLEEETRLSEYAASRRIKLCIARLANVYGDIKNNGVIGRIFQSLFSDRILVINGQGYQKRDYIFVKDAARLLSCLIEHREANQTEIYNLCTGEGYSIDELIECIEKITKRRINYTIGPAVLEKQIVIGDNRKILSLPGCKIKYKLIRGLKKTYANYQAKPA